MHGVAPHMCGQETLAHCWTAGPGVAPPASFRSLVETVSNVQAADVDAAVKEAAKLYNVPDIGADRRAATTKWPRRGPGQSHMREQDGNLDAFGLRLYRQ